MQQQAMDNEPGRRPVTSRRWIIGGVVAAAAAGACVAIFLWLRAEPPTTPPPALPPTVHAPVPAAEPVPVPPQPTAEKEGGDEEETATADELLQQLSTDALFHRWLAADDLVRRIVSAINAIADGGNPRKQLFFAAAPKRFSLVRKGDTIWVAPANNARYNALARVAATVNPAIAARAYKALLPTFERIQSEVGPPGRSFEATLRRALTLLTAVKVPPGDIELVSGPGASFQFTNRALERLSPAQKGLVRMGAKNAKIVQSKLREIAAAIGLEL